MMTQPVHFLIAQISFYIFYSANIARRFPRMFISLISFIFPQQLQDILWIREVHLVFQLLTLNIISILINLDINSFLISIYFKYSLFSVIILRCFFHGGVEQHEYKFVINNAEFTQVNNWRFTPTD